jgi:hypothetical protein
VDAFVTVDPNGPVVFFVHGWHGSYCSEMVTPCREGGFAGWICQRGFDRFQSEQINGYSTAGVGLAFQQTDGLVRVRYPTPMGRLALDLLQILIEAGLQGDLLKKMALRSHLDRVHDQPGTPSTMG